MKKGTSPLGKSIGDLSPSFFYFRGNIFLSGQACIPCESGDVHNDQNDPWSMNVI
jgi:hypothetical protein